MGWAPPASYLRDRAGGVHPIAYVTTTVSVRAITDGLQQFTSLIERDYFTQQGRWQAIEERTWEKIAIQVAENYVRVLEKRK